MKMRVVDIHDAVSDVRVRLAARNSNDVLPAILFSSLAASRIRMCWLLSSDEDAGDRMM